MTAKKARRVVIINDIKSDMIEQAIFILKSNDLDKLPQGAGNSLVAEAQNIINSYIGTVERSSARIQKKGGTVARLMRFGAVRRVLYVLAAVCAVAAVIATSTLIIDFVVKASNIG